MEIILLVRVCQSNVKVVFFFGFNGHLVALLLNSPVLKSHVHVNKTKNKQKPASIYILK